MLSVLCFKIFCALDDNASESFHRCSSSETFWVQLLRAILQRQFVSIFCFNFEVMMTRLSFFSFVISLHSKLYISFNLTQIPLSPSFWIKESNVTQHNCQNYSFICTFFSCNQIVQSLPTLYNALFFHQLHHHCSIFIYLEHFLGTFITEP